MYRTRRSFLQAFLLGIVIGFGGLVASGQTTFYAALDGAQQVPPVATAARGAGTVTLNAAETAIDVTLSFAGLGSAQTLAHIHGIGPRGTNAPVFLNIPLGSPATVTGVAVSQQEVAWLKAGLFYFNVHTSGNPGGEIRGQIERGASRFSARLDSAQETPSTASIGTGVGTVVLNAAETHVNIAYSFSGLTSNNIASHVHGNAPRGTAAGVLIGLPPSGATSGSFTQTNVPVTPTDVANLKAGLWYFNVHTTTFGGGEIRGQIESDCVDAPSGAISWYRGEGNALDQNALNNGTLNNGPAFVAGRSGRAFSFNGSNYVQAPDSASLNVSSQLTIEGWINASAFGGGRRLVDKITPATSNGYLIQLLGDKVNFIAGPNNLISVQSLFANTWTHVAGVYDGVTMRIFVNGVEDASGGGSGAIPANANPLRIGIDQDGNNAFSGVLDEFAIYGRALSQSEIRSIVDAGAAGKCPSCAPVQVGLSDWWTADGNLFGVRNRSNGVFESTATFAEGLSGHAYSFPNAGSVVVPDSSALDVTTRFTFDAWINPAGLHNGVGSGGIISKVGGGAGNNGYQFGLANNNTQIYCQFNAIGEPWPANQLVANVGSGIPLNTWSHVACTYDNSSLRIFLNGVEVGILAVGPKSVINSSANLRFSRDDNLNQQFNGMIDEPQVFGRALSQGEIASIVNAGRSCKCKPTATTAPANLVGWWAGDGNGNNTAVNNHHGNLQNGASFRVGKISQALRFDGVDDHMVVADHPDLRISGTVTIEFWAKRNRFGVDVVMEKGGDWTQGQTNYGIGLHNVNNNMFYFFYAGGGKGVDGVSDLDWHHYAVVATNGQSSATFYIDGVQRPVAHTFGAGTVNLNPSTLPLHIGGQVAPFPTYGQNDIDEMSIYNGGLSAAEIRSIYNADLAGKYKSALTGPPPFAGKGSTDGTFTVTVGDATVFVETVTSPGVTQSVPLSLVGLPPLPNQSMDLTYDISTTASYTGSPVVCFNVPSFTVAQFPTLRVLHLENGNWVNRTASSSHPNLCTTPLPSLSPFAIVNNLAPVAANVGVGGRVTTANGQGLRGASVSITDPDGVTRRAVTSSFGYYRFDDVAVGRTYVMSVASKRYSFSPRAVTIEDELSDLDFVAQP